MDMQLVASKAVVQADVLDLIEDKSMDLLSEPQMVVQLGFV